jgi:hypothetical protein
MEFKSFYFSMLLVGLCVVGIFGFVISVQNNYSVQNPIVNNSNMAFVNNLTTTLGGTQATATNAQNATYSAPPSVDTGGLMLTTIVSGGQILTGTIQAIYDGTIGFVANILGVSSIVIVVFSAMLIGGLILMIWSLIRLGR